MKAGRPEPKLLGGLNNSGTQSLEMTNLLHELMKV